MLTHYIKIAYRNLKKNKGIAFINIFGLAVGMTCAILIFLWVEQQLSYDQGIAKKERIYRLETNDWVVMPPYLRETVSVFPEIEEAVRFYFWWEPTLKYEDNVFSVTDFALVDSNVFKVFDFKFLAGDPTNALLSPYSIVLTESIAKKLFGNENPVGKPIQISNLYDYHVTGVVADIEKLHMNINAFVSVNDITRIDGSDEFLKDRNYNFDIYVLTHPNVNIKELVKKINDYAAEVENFDKKNLLLRPFNDIYFEQNLQHEKNTKHGNMNLIIVFSIVAVLILGIACINFVNLTVAKTNTREKEIAVRKVAGAKQRSLQKQFFGETFAVVIIAFIAAMIMVNLFLPAFNNLTAENISITSFGWEFVLMLGGILLFTGFVSGIYPSLYLSMLQPVLILKGKSCKGRKSSSLSKILIAFQFAISTFLIISTLIVMKQLNFMQTTDLGMNNEQILVCVARGDKFSGELEDVLASKRAFTERLKSYPEIKGVTFMGQIPGNITNTWNIYYHDENNRIPFRVIQADPDFIDIMDIKITAGQNFSYDKQTDLGTAWILNEEAVKQLGIENPIGDAINGGQIPVIGVVKDFHFNSLHNKIEPMAIAWYSFPRRACIKIAGSDIDKAIKHIESVYREFCPGVGFEYEFMDESFAVQYEAEKQLEEIISYFVSIAIILSCLGLFALTALIAQQKTREIGIRKVLGSTHLGIVKMISTSFAVWILISNLIAWPLAYFILNSWLQTFAYHIDINLFYFLMGGVSALTVAVLTIGYQALKAASINPVESLRHE